jgi:hypothetical protein
VQGQRETGQQRREPEHEGAPEAARRRARGQPPTDEREAGRKQGLDPPGRECIGKRCRGRSLRGDEFDTGDHEQCAYARSEPAGEERRGPLRARAEEARERRDGEQAILASGYRAADHRDREPQVLDDRGRTEDAGMEHRPQEQLDDGNERHRGDGADERAILDAAP